MKRRTIAFMPEGSANVVAAAAIGAGSATVLLVGVVQTVFVFEGPGGGAWTSMRVWVMAQH